MAAAQRRELHDVLEVVVFDDDSTSFSSSKQEDMDILLYTYHEVFYPKPPLQARISLKDCSKVSNFSGNLIKVASKKDATAECAIFAFCRFGGSDLVRLKRALNVP